MITGADLGNIRRRYRLSLSEMGRRLGYRGNRATVMRMMLRYEHEMRDQELPAPFVARLSEHGFLNGHVVIVKRRKLP